MKQHKKFYKKKTTENKALSKNQKKVVSKIVQKKINKFVEDKHLPIASNQASSGTYYKYDGLGELYNLSTVPQSTGDTGRVGDEIDARWLEIRVSVFAPFNTAIGSYLTRIIIFRWKEINAHIPINEDLLDLSSTTTDYQNVLSPLNWKTFPSRAHLYKDILIGQSSTQTGTTTSGGGAYNNPYVRTFKIFLKNVKQTYQNLTGLGSNTSTNQFYMAVYGQSVVGPPANAQSINWSSKFTYKDA